MIEKETRLVDLLLRFPTGFIVDPNGMVYQVHSAHASTSGIVNPENISGYLGVVIALNPPIQNGDEQYFDNSKIQPEPEEDTQQQTPAEVADNMAQLMAKLKTETPNPHIAG